MDLQSSLQRHPQLKEIPEDFAAALIKGYEDPVFFARYFCGIDPFQGFEINPDGTANQEKRIYQRGQTGWLTQDVLFSERILSTGNRWGKSLIEAVKHIWLNIYKIRRNSKFNHIYEYRTCNIAITIEQSKLIWEEAARIMTSQARLSWMLKNAPIRKPFPALKWSNGATFTCRSTDQPANLWGNWYDFVSYDEAACEKKPDETIPLIKTRLMDHDGMLDYISTPGYSKNWFFKIKQHARLHPKEFFLLTGSNRENPHISEEARNKFTQNMTKDQILVHIEGEDIDAGGYVFKAENVEAGREPSLDLIEHRKNERYVHRHFTPGHRYVDGWDIATKKDYLVGITIDITDKPFKLVAFERYHKIPWAYVYDRIRERHREYKSFKKIDVTGVGDHLPEELADLTDFILPINFAKPKIKTNIIIAGQKALEDRTIIYPHIPPLIEQLTFYEWDDKNLETDCVIAFCLALFETEGIGNEFTGDASEIMIGEKTSSQTIMEDLNRRKVYA